MPFGRDLWNTCLYAGLSSFGVIISSVPVAYAVARMKFRGRDVFFIVILATMMIPAQVTSLPVYVLFAKIGWIGSLKPLIVPSFFGDAFSIFLLRQFFLTLPRGDHRSRQGRWRRRVPDPPPGRHPDGQTGDRCGGTLRLHVRVERLLQPVALHRQQHDGPDAGRRY